LNRQQAIKIIEDIIIKIIGDKRLFTQLSEKDSLYEDGIGLDSFGYMQLIFELEKQYNIIFTDEIWDNKKILTVSDFIDHLLSAHNELELQPIYDHMKHEAFMYHHIIEINSRINGDKFAVMEDGAKITYKKLWELIKSMTYYFRESGVEKGSAVMLFLPNSVNFIVTFFACAYLGVRMVLADIKLAYELVDMIDENGVKYVFTDGSGLEHFNRLIGNSKLSNMKFKDVSQILLQIKEKHYSSVIDAGVCQDEISVILYTSGSEGRPKGVINTYYTISQALINYTSTIKFSNEDRIIAVIPFFHSYAFGSCFLAGLASGAMLLLQDSFSPKKIIRLIEQEEAAVFQGVPYMYKLLNHIIAAEKPNMSHLRLCISAAGPLAEGESTLFYKLTGKVIHQEYGSTETVTIALNLNESLEMNQVSVGKALNGVNVVIKDCDENGVGKISVQSKGMSYGYANEPPFSRSEYIIGDLGYLDENGYIFIVGRDKRFINISGKKVNPYEIEKIILEHDKVKQVYVYGVEDKNFGQSIKALVVKKDLTLTKEELIALCREKLALHKIPGEIEWREELSVSQLGKVINSNIKRERL